MSSLTGIELHEACSQGDYQYVEDLLRTGKFNVNLKDPDWEDRTPLHWACAKGYVQCVNALLARGAEGSARMAMDWTPAHLAAEAGKLNVLRALHDGGVALNIPDIYGDTPRRVAQIYNHEECVSFLEQIEAETNQESTTTTTDVSTAPDDTKANDVS